MNELVESPILEAPIVANPSLKPRLAHAFTSETAKAFSAMAIQAKRDRAEKAKSDAAKLAKMQPGTERLSGQLSQIEELMDGEKDADTLQKLSAAHARIFSAWQVLSGTPNPGARKSSGKRQSHQMAEPLPIEPAQAVTSGHVGPENG